MAVKIIGLIIGLPVFGAGVCYLAKERHDPESEMIYGIVGIIAAVCAVLLFI